VTEDPAARRGSLRTSPGALAAALIDEAQRTAASGRRALARQRYESALYLLQEGNDATACAILRRVGRTYLDDGDIPAALDCLEGARAVADICGQGGELAHTINVIGVAHWQRGELEASARCYHESARMARDVGDHRLVSLVEQNLGILAGMQGELETALGHYSRSLDILDGLGLGDEAAQLLSNIGLTHAKLGRLDEADRCYARAAGIATRVGDDWTAMMVDVNRAALHIERRHFDSAGEICDRILRQAGALHETRLLAETFKHSGVIARERGELERADTLLRRAYEEATVREDQLLAAEAMRELAELHLRTGRNRDALQALSVSHRLFTHLHAQQDLEDVGRRLRSLENRFHDAVQAWAQTIESKDSYTLGHCERVADYACALALQCGVDDASLFWFRVGALLHDVGKIVVPEDILNKPGPLTPEERRIMEGHPVAGVELLADVEFPWDVMPMIRGHHERYDGHGYPDRLAGEAIPLAARILCVADVFDALTTARPYRRAYSPADALRLMQADIGRQFDPDVLRRFFQLMLNENAGGAMLTPPAFSPRGFDSSGPGPRPSLLRRASAGPCP
jgi:putative nucleotidyltransferase with HDIG domain